jgi:hypothetical protein
MYTRVVRFADVSPERMESLVQRVNEADGPPAGVPFHSVTFLYDASQGTAVVLQQFETMGDLEEGAKALSAMDSSDTPGTRVSVDACEQKLELEL